MFFNSQPGMTPLANRLTMIVVLIVAALAGALLFEALLSIGSPSPFAHTRQGHLMGWVGLGVILLVLVYPIRKRLSRNDRWPRGWFQVHMTAGVIGVGALLLLPAALIELQGHPLPTLSLKEGSEVLLLGAGASGLAYLFYNVALQDNPYPQGDLP